MEPKAESVDELQALRAKGDELAQRGRTKDAIALYLEASQKFIAQRAHPRTVAACKEVLKIDPQCIKAHLMLVDAYDAMGWTKHSLYHLREVESFARHSGDDGAVQDVQKRVQALQEKGSPAVKVKPQSMEATLTC